MTTAARVAHQIVPDFERNVFCVLGLTLDAVSLAEAKALVLDAVRGRRRLFITTPNSNFLSISRSDPAFQNSIACSDLCLADGMPLVLVSRIIGAPIRERVSGSSLFETLMGDAEARMNVFFLGGAEGIAQAASERLNQSSPNLRSTGYLFPGYSSVDEMSTQDIFDQINSSGADFLMLAFGAQKGQRWILENEGRLNVPVIAYLGSTVNFVANLVARAPLAWQHLGLEWAWRIRQEPHLWRRYYADLRFLLRLLVSRVIPLLAYNFLARPSKREVGKAQLSVSKENNCHIFRFNGSWCEANLGPARRAFAEATEKEADIILDFEKLGYADSAFFGLLLIAYGHQIRVGRRFSIGSLSITAKVALYLHACEFVGKPS